MKPANGATGFEHTITSCGPCGHCENLLPPLQEIVGEYFERRSARCPSCGKDVDIWNVVHTNLTQRPTFFGIGGLVTSSTLFSFQLSKNRLTEIDLTAYEVPENATVLDINCTPQDGGVFPVVYQGNSLLRRMQGTRLRLFGMPLALAFKNAPDAKSSTISMAVTWVPRGESETRWLYLVDACDAFASERYTHMIVPAHAAVELSLMPLVSDLLRKQVSRERVQSFVSDELSYGHALNVLLPFVCGTLGIPLLPMEIRGLLNRLKDRRNNFVHEGMKPQDIGASEAAELLCAAVFGFEYVDFARRCLKAEGQV